jgi:hypothetical protein
MATNFSFLEMKNLQKPFRVINVSKKKKERKGSRSMIYSAAEK